MVTFGVITLFLLLLLFGLQSFVTNYYMIRLFSTWCYVFVVLDLGIFVYLLFSYNVNYAATRGGVQWMTYSWVLLGKVAIYFWFIFGSAGDPYDLILFVTPMGMYAVFFFTPILYTILSFRAARQLYGPSTISLESMLHADMVIHVMFDLLDLVAAFSFADLPEIVNDENPWLHTVSGVVIAVGIFMHSYSFPTSGGPNAPAASGTQPGGVAASVSPDYKMRLHNYPEYQGDIFLTRKHAALVATFIVDIPLLVIRLYVWISYPKNPGFSPYLVKNIIFLPIQAFRLNQCRLAERERAKITQRGNEMRRMEPLLDREKVDDKGRTPKKHPPLREDSDGTGMPTRAPIPITNDAPVSATTPSAGAEQIAGRGFATPGSLPDGGAHRGRRGTTSAAQAAAPIGKTLDTSVQHVHHRPGSKLSTTVATHEAELSDRTWRFAQRQQHTFQKPLVRLRSRQSGPPPTRSSSFWSDDIVTNRCPVAASSGDRSDCGSSNNSRAASSPTRIFARPRWGQCPASRSSTSNRVRPRRGVDGELSPSAAASAPRHGESPESSPATCSVKASSESCFGFPERRRDRAGGGRRRAGNISLDAQDDINSPQFLMEATYFKQALPEGGPRSSTDDNMSFESSPDEDAVAAAAATAAAAQIGPTTFAKSKAPALSPVAIPPSNTRLLPLGPLPINPELLAERGLLGFSSFPQKGVEKIIRDISSVRQIPVAGFSWWRVLVKIYHCLRIGGRHGLSGILDETFILGYWKQLRISLPLLVAWSSQIVLVAVTRAHIQSVPSDPANWQTWDEVPWDFRFFIYLAAVNGALIFFLWVGTAPFLDVIYVTLLWLTRLSAFFLFFCTVRDTKSLDLPENLALPSTHAVFMWGFVAIPTVRLLDAFFPIQSAFLGRKYMYFTVPLTNKTLQTTLLNAASHFRDTSGEGVADTRLSRIPEAGWVSTSSVLVLHTCRHSLAPMSFGELLIGPDVIKDLRLMDMLVARCWVELFVVLVFRVVSLFLFLNYVNVGVFVGDLLLRCIYLIVIQAIRLLALRRYEVKILFEEVVRTWTHPDPLSISKADSQEADDVLLRRDDSQFTRRSFSRTVLQRSEAHRHMRVRRKRFVSLLDVVERYQRHGVFTSPGDLLPCFV